MSLGDPLTSYTRLGALTGSNSTELPCFVAPMACTIQGIDVVDITGITGHTQNYATVAITNKGTTGGGSDSVATRSTNAATTGDITAWKAWPVTLSGTASNLQLADGEVLTLKLTEAGTGQDLADCGVAVHYVPGTGEVD